MNVLSYTSLSGSKIVEPKRPYHHGDLRNTLLRVARQILEEKSPAALSLREVARIAGVSHAAPYRHFPSHEALLAELATEGFVELKATLVAAPAADESPSDRIAAIGAAYIRFVTERPALARLMFGPQMPHREQYPKLTEAADAIAAAIGAALEDPARGLAVWAAVHGLGLLILENVIDLGQRDPDADILSARTETLLRNLLAVQEA